MSDLGFAFPGPGFKLIAPFAERRGFTPDRRFGEERRANPPVSAPPPEPEAQGETVDPLGEAFSQGFAEGFEQARQAAAARAEADDAARAALGLSLERIDGELAEQLRLRLRETVAALCESALAPLAIDAGALERRIAKAVAMLARSEDERVLRLHPEDIALISPELARQWELHPDPTLPRGTIRVETASGGVEDGPDAWRQAIAEALHDC
ncbi:flagellar biosynthesis protein [Novosphingobium profundi]|nr:flagellar biosynthesis protein [Novosphingobium profundi]